MNFLNRNLNFLNLRRWYLVNSMSGTYVREPWCLGPNTMAPVAKKQPPTTISSTDGAWSFFKKYLKTLYGNLIGLNKGYK